MKKNLTLCLVRQDNQLLLGYKKKGFGKKRWNGFGGKVERGENLLSAAKRELLEEAGIEAKVLDKVGEIDFSFAGSEEKLLVHIFFVQAYKGEIIETEEMRPAWFNIAEIPYDQMWVDDKYWLPLVLDNKKVKANFLLSSPTDNKIIKQVINIVDKF